MTPNDFPEFKGLLSGVLSMWDKAPSAEASAVWFRSLEGHSLQNVSAAFSAHMRDPANGKYEPKPAHIIEQIEKAAKSDGRPGAEEAWAISLAGKSEADTVVWTTECAQAWFAALPVMNMGDEVGARMAFKEAYARLVLEARARREPVSWEVSEGFDKERRRVAIASAIDAGRINPGLYLAIDHSANLMLGMSGASAGGVPSAVREKLAALREQMTKRDAGHSESEAEAARIAELKKAQQAKVDQYMKGEK